MKNNQFFVFLFIFFIALTFYSCSEEHFSPEPDGQTELENLSRSSSSPISGQEVENSSLFVTGDLLWYKHLGKDNGAASWASGSGGKVGTGLERI